MATASASRVSRGGSWREYRGVTDRKPRGIYEPKELGEHSRWEFQRRRTKEYSDWLGGPPNAAEALLIKGLIDTEWRRKEHEAEAAKRSHTSSDRRDYLRMAADQQRLWVQHYRDLATLRRERVRGELSSPPAPSIGDIIAEASGRREAPG